MSFQTRKTFIFIFGAQIKIFLIRPESSQTLHSLQGYYHDQGPET